MPFRRRSNSEFVTAEPEQRGVGAFLKRWTIPIIGALTPTALIVVNISAFIVIHLTQFRWTISILAFVSGLMLNSWAGLNIYRMLQQRRPDHAIVNERNQEIVLVIGMAVVIIAAFLTALFCYLGLAKNNLPNGLTFFTGFFAAAIPIFLRAAFHRTVPRGRGRGGSQITSVAGLPPGDPVPPPMPSSSINRTIPRR